MGNQNCVIEIQNQSGDQKHSSAKVKGLTISFASDLPLVFTPQSEIVQGLLSAGAASLIYGPKNSGKTFIALDLAAAVSQGLPWMGRKTIQGLVVYIAAESRYSADVRLHALQAHKKLRFNNLAVIDGELDLFSGSKGVEALISAIKEIEATRRQKVVLVIGDTLARLGAGANENAAQDMGLIVRNIDRVRSACKTHICMIHHSGKEANGSRGSTALPAAVDTEIEIGSGKNGSFAKVMKQRDLSSKGNVIGFRLQPVRVGQDQWGEEVTTCVVEARDAALDTTPISNKKPTIEDDVLKYLNVQTKFVEKRQVVDAMKAKFGKSASVVYRALASLGNKGLVRSNAQGEVQIV